MPLHPEIQQFLAMSAELGAPRLYTLSPEEAREAVRQTIPLIGDGPAVATVEDFRLGEIGARRYAPERSHATIVWFHGGGWVLANLDTHDAMCRILANAAECTVISVDYRLAPEHPFPAALEDAWDALTRVAASEPGPLVVGGDSAGGNLAAVCALRARDRGGPELAAQVLVYPVTDHDLNTRSYIEHGGEDTLMGKAEMVWFWDSYVPDVADRDNPEVSPLRAADHSNLPSAIVVTDEYDPLRDEGLAYVEKLRQAGVPVTARHHEDVLHGFFSYVNLFSRGNEAVEEVGRDIRAVLGAAAPAPS